MEYGHHIQWLSDVIEILDKCDRSGMQPDAVDRGRLETGLSECTLILAQNSESELAKKTRQRIDTILTGSASHGEKAVNKRAITTEDAEEMEKLIVEIKSGMERLHDLLDEGRGRNNREEIPSLLAPCQIALTNRKNTYRNFPRHWLDVDAGKAPQNYTINANQYSYDIVPKRFAKERSDVFGGYDARYNIVRMPEGFDPSRLIDLSFLYHELAHVLQTHSLMSQIGTAAHRDFYASGRRIILPFEVEAHAFQYEMMDVIAGGWLSQGSSQGDSPERLERFLREFGGLQQHEQIARSILKGMKLFFPYGWKPQKQPHCERAFHDAIRRAYQTEGELYGFNAQGHLVPA